MTPGYEFDQGKWFLPDQPGLGVQLSPDYEQFIGACISTKSKFLKHEIMSPSISLLFLTLINYAQINDTISLWPNEVPGKNEAKHKPVQIFNTKQI